VGAGVGAGAGVAFPPPPPPPPLELPPPPPELTCFFAFAGAGSEPDGVNAATCGAAGTLTGVTADGAAVLLLLTVAFPIPNAAPNATIAATTPPIASRGAAMDTSSSAWSCPG
jgi:hypothetical protein